MCNTWQFPSRKKDEFQPDLIDKLPVGLSFINITGGEPFLRSDIEEIVEKSLAKTKRLVISSNGYFTNRIIHLFQRFGNQVGIRISIEGLPAANDELRGIRDGFDHGLRSLATLHSMGIKDIGFGMTVSDRNAADLIDLYRLANAMRLEFATATTHNSFYFHTTENHTIDSDKVAASFEAVALELLKTNKPKNWFRAYFNMGLARKARKQKRVLPCEVGTDMFFLDPAGNIMPCNGSSEPMIMGNLNLHDFKDIWKGPKAEEVRRQVKSCTRECWMIGSASPAMKKHLARPAWWVLKNKLQLLLRKKGHCCLGPIGR